MTSVYGPPHMPKVTAAAVNPNAPVKRPEGSLLSAEEKAAISAQAEDFEGMFMAQMLQFMWTGIETDETFGGGHGEDQWRGMMIEEYGKVSAKAGNLGIADAVKSEMIRAQERMKEALAIPSVTSPHQTTPVQKGDA